MAAEKAFTGTMKDLTDENITANVHIINSQCDDRRLKFLINRLVVHLHDFVRETRLSSKEWVAAIHFLTEVGQICSDVRQVSKSIKPSSVLNQAILTYDIGIRASLRHPRRVIIGRFCRPPLPAWRD